MRETTKINFPDRFELLLPSSSISARSNPHLPFLPALLPLVLMNPCSYFRSPRCLAVKHLSQVFHDGRHQYQTCRGFFPGAASRSFRVGTCNSCTRTL